MARGAKICISMGGILMMTVAAAAIAVADQDRQRSTDAAPFQDFLHKDCKMEKYWSREKKTISIEDGRFEPSIHLYLSSSITLETESGDSLALNLSQVPVYRPMAAIFDLQSLTFRVSPSPMVIFDLAIVGANGTTIRPKFMTFEKVLMTTGNCTNGLPHYHLSEWLLAPAISSDGSRLLLLSTGEGGGDSAISATTSGRVDFSFCNDGGESISIRRGKPSDLTDCKPIPKGIPHLIKLSHDSENNETKVNGVTLPDPDGWVGFFHYISLRPIDRSHYHLVYCALGVCPTPTELNTPPANASATVDPICYQYIDPTDKVLLVMAAIELFILMGIDGIVMIYRYIRRRFFDEDTQDEDLQWHLDTMPLPWEEQPPPPLPDRPAPPMPEFWQGRRLVVEKQEEQSEEELEDGWKKEGDDDDDDDDDSE